MQHVFPSGFFIGNRTALMRAVEPGTPVVLAAHGLLQRAGDSPFPFHQDSNFWYLTGIHEPDLVLVMDDRESYIIVPGRSSSREAFDGAVDTEALSKVSGIDMFFYEEEGWRRLAGRLKKTRKVQTLLPPRAYIEQYGMYTNPSRGRLVDRMRHWQADLGLVDVREHLIAMRMYKQPEELAAIQKAIDCTVRGIQQVASRKQMRRYEYEFEIENDLTAAFRTVEAAGHAFTPIVAAGKRACTLHNVGNDGMLADGSLVVIDVGAEVSHYAADITRTVAYGGYSERQQAVHSAVLAAQKYALSLLKPGTMLKEYEQQVETCIGERLQELGLVEKADHDSIRRYYPHAASHFLGLDVHDAGDYSRPLAPGMVLTCEPGIYIPEEGIGVRIEDDVLITETGNTVLSDALPRELSAYA